MGKKTDIHECFDNVEITGDSGCEGFLTCKICGETFTDHRFVCWVRPYPHLSDKMIEFILDKFLAYDFFNDTYGEVDIPEYLVELYPDFYDVNGYQTTSSVESKGSYFYEFSDQETFDELSKKLEKLERYCVGWCFWNI